MKALIITLLLLAPFTTSREYPQTFIVTEVNQEADTITLEDLNGFTWIYEGCEDWEVNDIAAAIMNDNGTPDNITDDTIEVLKYTGYLE